MKRHGFTLIELLCVLLLVTIMAAAFARLLRQTIEVEQLQTAGFDKILRDNMLADQFRADVGRAASTPEQWQHFEADSGTLILQMPGGGHVVYALDTSGLQRQALEDGKSSAQTILAADPDVGVEFARDARNPKLLCLRLHYQRNGEKVSGQFLEIAAALGGDVR